ncbi:LysR family transcriptional regulator [Xinfangfangia sp. D13-10-4-6]|uniref:LysR family transcriptional regulator n=1 Tax=Pseudogemmobacter hezensis TaxID=2737662 RepID=UPI0015566FED|nr:LysR family transcriptional regulator [Pseudogemmobacter hezensis]NPD13908.1 LysR family transcriptional regulator [Pseudogemmobacter hezensis]
MHYSLDEIDTFLTVMELGTVTAAAARLNLSKSVVSKRLSDLETGLGAALFRRNAGRIIPTEAAGRLAERFRPALAELRQAAESAAWGGMSGDGASAEGLRGTLAIAAPMTFGTLHLTPLIADFAKAHPGLEIRVDYDDRARDLAREGFDLSIRIGLQTGSALMSRKLCEDRSLVCASPDFLAQHGRPARVQDLSGQPVIGYSHIPNAELWQLQENGRLIAPAVAERISVNNGEAMRDLAVAGLGFAMLPGFIAAPALRSGALVHLLGDCGTRGLPVMALWPPVQPMPLKLRRFIDHLAEAFGRGAPWLQDVEKGPGL